MVLVLEAMLQLCHSQTIVAMMTAMTALQELARNVNALTPFRAGVKLPGSVTCHGHSRCESAVQLDAQRPTRQPVRR